MKRILTLLLIISSTVLICSCSNDPDPSKQWHDVDYTVKSITYETEDGTWTSGDEKDMVDRYYAEGIPGKLIYTVITVKFTANEAFSFAEVMVYGGIDEKRPSYKISPLKARKIIGERDPNVELHPAGEYEIQLSGDFCYYMENDFGLSVHRDSIGFSTNFTIRRYGE